MALHLSRFATLSGSTASKDHSIETVVGNKQTCRFITITLDLDCEQHCEQHCEQTEFVPQIKSVTTDIDILDGIFKEYLFGSYNDSVGEPLFVTSKSLVSYDVCDEICAYFAPIILESYHKSLVDKYIEKRKKYLTMVHVQLDTHQNLKITKDVKFSTFDKIVIITGQVLQKKK